MTRSIYVDDRRICIVRPCFETDICPNLMSNVQFSDIGNVIFVRSKEKNIGFLALYEGLKKMSSRAKFDIFPMMTD